MLAGTIQEVREGLLALHKALIDMMREREERRLGHKIAPGELLRLLTTDASFDWLHPFSRLIVSIDELLERADPPTERDAAAVRVEVEDLLRSGAERYRAAVDDEPNVAFEHGRTASAIERLPSAPPEEHAALRELRSTWSARQRRRPSPN